MRLPVLDKLPFTLPLSRPPGLTRSSLFPQYNMATRRSGGSVIISGGGAERPPLAVDPPPGGSAAERAAAASMAKFLNEGNDSSSRTTRMMTPRDAPPPVFYRHVNRPTTSSSDRGSVQLSGVFKTAASPQPAMSTGYDAWHGVRHFREIDDFGVSPGGESGKGHFQAASTKVPSDETPVIDFNSPFPYYHTVGSMKLSESVRPRPFQRRANTATQEDAPRLDFGAVKRSHFSPLMLPGSDNPMSGSASAQNLAPFVSVKLVAAPSSYTDGSGLFGGVEYSCAPESAVVTGSAVVPYHRGASIPADVSWDSVKSPPTSALRRDASWLAMTAHHDSAVGRGGVASSMRDPSSRTGIHGRSHDRWRLPHRSQVRGIHHSAESAVSPGPGPVEYFDADNGYDDSGDEAERTDMFRKGATSLPLVPVIQLPPHPSAAVFGLDRTAALKSASGSLLPSSAPPPWQLHPHLKVPLMLLQARGVDLEEHGQLIAYHLHPALLNDCGRLSQGSYFAKYPSSTYGCPHRRYFFISVMHFETNHAEPMLIWKTHRDATAITDAIPLAWLVGVSVGSDKSPVLSKFHHSKYTDALVGPRGEDAERTLIPRSLGMTLWFVDRVREQQRARAVGDAAAKPTYRTVDVATTSRADVELWVTCLRGLIVMNSVEIHNDQNPPPVPATSFLQPLIPRDGGGVAPVNLSQPLEAAARGGAAADGPATPPRGDRATAAPPALLMHHNDDGLYMADWMHSAQRHAWTAEETDNEPS
mgnify:CR=1 FL=1